MTFFESLRLLDEAIASAQAVCRRAEEELMRQDRGMFPAGRNGSAIPLAAPRDPVSVAGEQWHDHVAVCGRCDVINPVCPGGWEAWARYTDLIASERKW